MSRKIFTSHEELLAACEADKMYFLMPRSAGDLYMQLLYKEALQERFGGEIVFVAKASQEGICEMFEGEFLLINNALAQLFLSPECLKLRGVFRTPTRGGIFPSHPIPLDIPVYFNEVFDFVANTFDLPKSFKPKFKLPTKLPCLSQELREKLPELSRVALIAPEANTCANLSLELFEREVKTLQEAGFEVVLNAVCPQNFKPQDFGVRHFELSLKDAIALASECAKVVSVRSGFCDIIAPFAKDLRVIYTDYNSLICFKFKEGEFKRISSQVLAYDLLKTPALKRFLLLCKTKAKIAVRGCFRGLYNLNKPLGRGVWGQVQKVKRVLKQGR